MPTYEYECVACKHTFEIVQRMTDDPIKVCPKCGKRVEKVFHAVPILFNGPGFHINDYPTGKRGKSRSSRPKTETETKTVTKKSEPKTDSTTDKTSSGTNES